MLGKRTQELADRAKSMHDLKRAAKFFGGALQVVHGLGAVRKLLRTLAQHLCGALMSSKLGVRGALESSTCATAKPCCVLSCSGVEFGFRAKTCPINSGDCP